MTSTLTVPGSVEPWTFTAPDGVTMTYTPDGHLNIAIDYTLADYDGQANGGSLINIKVTEPYAIDPSGTPNNNFDVGLIVSLTMQITNDTGLPISGYIVGLENEGGEPTDVGDAHPHYAHFHNVTTGSFVDAATGQPNASLELFAPGTTGAFGPVGDVPAPSAIYAPNGMIAAGATEDLVGTESFGGVTLHSEDFTPGPDGGNFTLFFTPSNLIGYQPLSASDAADPTSVYVGSFMPFQGLNILDSNTTEMISATLISPYQYPTTSATGGGSITPDGNNTYTIAGTAAQVQAILNGLTINASSPGSISLAVNNSTDTQVVFNDTITVNPGVVTGSDTIDPPSGPVSNGQTIKPFANAIISDTSPTEQLGLFIAVPAGFKTSDGGSFTGTAAQLTKILDGFTATATIKAPTFITASVTNPDAADKQEAVFRFIPTLPGGSGLKMAIGAQVTTITNDTVQFYNDQKLNIVTSPDVTQLLTDLTGLTIDKPTLGQILAAALQTDAGNNAATLGVDLADVYFGTINNDLQSQSSNLGADLNTMMTKTVAVGGTYAGLVATESPASALAQTVKQYSLTG